MAERRYCEDCRFCFVPPSGIEFARCISPAAPTEDLTERRFLSRRFDVEMHPYSSVMRMGDHRCGQDGKWFEPKIEVEAA